MRGDKELACLIELQNSIFAINPFNSKSFRDVTDEEFENEHIMYISIKKLYIEEVEITRKKPKKKPNKAILL